jgi:hypothetical protein
MATESTPAQREQIDDAEHLCARIRTATDGAFRNLRNAVIGRMGQALLHPAVEVSSHFAKCLHLRCHIRIARNNIGQLV